MMCFVFREFTTETRRHGVVPPSTEIHPVNPFQFSAEGAESPCLRTSVVKNKLRRATPPGAKVAVCPKPEHVFRIPFYSSVNHGFPKHHFTDKQIFSFLKTLDFQRLTFLFLKLFFEKPTFCRVQIRGKSNPENFRSPGENTSGKDAA